MRLGIALFSNIPAGLPVSGVEVLKQPPAFWLCASFEQRFCWAVLAT